MNVDIRLFHGWLRVGIYTVTTKTVYMWLGSFQWQIANGWGHTHRGLWCRHHARYQLGYGKWALTFGRA